MKKILFLIHTLGGGGAEKVLINLVNNLDEKKYDITVMTLIDRGVLKKDLAPHIHYRTTLRLKEKMDDINTSGSLLNKPSKIKNILIKLYTIFWKYTPTKILYLLFVKEKYDIEVAFLEGISAKFIAGSANKYSKKYAWIHVDLINQTKSSNVFRNIDQEVKTYDKFNQIICVSKVAREQFIKKYKITEEKVVVKYNPIDEENIQELSREKIQVEKNKLIIGSIGRLNSQKAYDRLLRIHKKLLLNGYNNELWIIGEGTDKVKLQKYIKENNLDNTVNLLGFQRNPYKYLINFDLFVCSSRSEGFSTAVSEAIILGIPVVTTDCSGMKELLGDNNEYGIVTPNNEEDLYTGIEYILSNKETYNKYKLNCVKRKSIFSLKEAVDNIEKIFEEDG